MLLPVLRGAAEASAGTGRRIGGGYVHRKQSAGIARVAEDQISAGAWDSDGLGGYGEDMAVYLYG